jgi:hypothetical protein
MMNEMMKNSCGVDGKPDFEKMKGMMEDCGCGCNPPFGKSETDKTESKEEEKSKQGG